MRDEKEIRHVIGLAVSSIEETPLAPDRYVRVIRVRAALGYEFTLRLYSEGRLTLQTEADLKRSVWSIDDPLLHHRRPIDPPEEQP